MKQLLFGALITIAATAFTYALKVKPAPPQVYHLEGYYTAEQVNNLFQSISTSKFFTASDATDILSKWNNQVIEQNRAAQKQDSIIKAKQDSVKVKKP